MPTNLLTRNTISILNSTWYTNMNCRYTNTWATSKCYVILHLIFFPIPTSNWGCNVLSVTTETQTPWGMSILKYTFLYMKSDHLRSPRMVLVRIQKIIITDNSMEKWNPLCNVSGNVKWCGHWQKDKWQAGMPPAVEHLPSTCKPWFQSPAPQKTSQTRQFLKS